MIDKILKFEEYMQAIKGESCPHLGGVCEDGKDKSVCLKCHESYLERCGVQIPEPVDE
jgi:hypothetical protein